MEELELFDYIKTYKGLANHSLGQNFLIDPVVCKKIVKNINPQEGEKILEIGAGLGPLSFYLAKSEAEIYLLDIDERMTSFLSKKLFKGAENVKIKKADILKINIKRFDKIVGNLPYYITSDILEKMLLESEASEMVFMVQKEALMRLLKIDKKDATPLSLLLNDIANIKLLINVPRTAFTPAPRVDSVVFKMTFNEKRSNPKLKENYKIMTKLFKNRRKTVLNNLDSYINDKELSKQILKEAGIYEKLRPEQISIEQYYSLTNMLFIHKQLI